jgi:two-component system, cell cycle sensor histidine kinase and response regulator CckA
MKSELQNGIVSGNRAMTEQALRASELGNRRLAEPAADGLLILDADTGRITAVNPFLIKLLGLPQSEMVGKTVGGLGPFKDIVSDQAMWEELQKDGYVHYADLPLKTSAGRNIAAELVGNVYQIADKKMILCSIRDITGRKQAEAELRDSEQLFRTLAESVPQLVWMCQPDGMNIYFNQQWVDYTGLTLEESYGHGWNKPFHPDDRQRAWDAWQVATTKLGEYSIECRLRRADGEYRWWLIRGVPLRNAAGKVLKWFGTCTDIHEGKLAVEKLKLFRALIERTNDAIHVLDPATARFLDVNERACEDLGYTREEMLALSVFDVTMDVDRESFEVHQARVKKAGYATIEATHRRKDGTTYPVEVSLSSVTLDRDYVVAIIRDVSGRKRVEAALRESETRLLSILESTGDGILAVDKTGKKVLKTNRRFAEMWRIPQSLMDAGDNHAMMDFVRGQLTSPEVFLKNESLYNSPATGMDTLEFQDGRIFESHAFPMMMDGVVTGRVWSFRDITKRRQAEAALRESEHRFQTLTAISPVGIFHTDAQGQTTYVNPRWCEIAGWPATDALGNGWLGAVHAEDREKLVGGWQTATGAQSASKAEYRFVHPDGSISWVMGQAVPEKDTAGRVVGYVGTITDITERKRAEDALRGSETLLKETQTIAGLGSYDMDITTGIWRGSDVLDRIFGIDKTYECSVEGWKNLIHPDDRAMMVDYLRNEVFDQGRAFDKEYRIIRHSDQAERWVHGLGRLEFDAQGRPVKMLGTIQDITERKRAMEELRNRETQLRLALDAARMGTWDWDIQTGHVVWSSGHEALWGYAPGTFPGTYEGYESRLHPDDVEGARRAGQKALDEHTNYEHEYRVRWPDGTERWIAARGQAFYGPDGKPMRMTGVAMDITEHKRAEKVLQMFQFATDRAADAVFWMNRDGSFYYVNDEACRSLGYTREDLMQLSLFDIDPGHSEEQWQENWLRFDQNNMAQCRWERTHCRKDGSTFPVEIMVRHFSTGEIDVRVAFVRDITERKRADQALQQERNLLRTLIDNIPDYIFVRDTSNRFILANKSIARLMGVPQPADLIGKRDADFYPPELAAIFDKIDQEVFAGHLIPNEERVLRFPNGQELTVLNTKVPFKNDQGEVIGLIGIGRDITERKRAEESQARLATAVEQAAETVVITDTTGKILYANPAFEKASGYTRAEALGQNPRILKSGKQDAEFYRRMWEVLHRGEVWSGRFMNRRKDGAFYEEEATISPVRDANGKVVNYVAVKRDVTREVQLEAQFRQAQKMEAVGQLASGVAHDFNNILNVIIGYGDLIASDLEPDSPLRTYAEELRTAAERAVGLTKQLLVFSRKQKVELVVLDLNETVVNLEKMLRRLIGENIEMAIVPGKDTGRIKADAGYIGQVLMNLAVNARDAMPKGGKLTIATDNVTLDENHARIHAGTAPGDYVMLTVSDTGTGMTPEVKARIFEALFTTKPAGKGTGLGLVTCQAIVQQSGGHIEVDTGVGRGTTFKVYFPRVDKPVKADDGPDQTGALPRGTETLLVVEDEPSVRHLAWKVLKALGYHVLRANNGQDALHLVHEYSGPPIRLVITDVMMPVMGGKVMADWLKATYPDLKILFSSGYTDDAIAQEGVLEPGVAFLPKPYTPEALARTVRAMLDNETDTSVLRKPGATLNPPPAGSPGNP